jgi:hypothetical protein
MNGISLILAALLAGASTGVGNVAAESVKDAYEALRRVVARRLAEEPEPEALIDGYLADPGGAEEPLRTALQRTGADRDEDVLGAARVVVGLAGPRGEGPNNSATVIDSAYVQVGNGNFQINGDNTRKARSTRKRRGFRARRGLPHRRPDLHRHRGGAHPAGDLCPG